MCLALSPARRKGAAQIHRRGGRHLGHGIAKTQNTAKPASPPRKGEGTAKAPRRIRRPSFHRAQARPARGDRHHRRIGAGDVPRRAEPDHRGDGAADHRPRLRRFRESVLGGDRLSVDLDRGRAALRQAQRHLRPARHDAGGARRVHGGLGRLRRRAEHADADPRPRPARHRRRRHRAADPIDHRRRGAAARARLLPGLYRFGLDRRRRRRPGARRRHCRASALVGDLLAQRAARLGGGAVVQPATQTRAGPRTRPQDRSHRRRADDGRRGRAAAGADLGRHALSVAVAADRRSDHCGGRASARPSSGGCCGRRSRSCRSRCSTIR